MSQLLNISLISNVLALGAALSVRMDGEGDPSPLGRDAAPQDVLDSLAVKQNQCIDEIKSLQAGHADGTTEKTPESLARVATLLTEAEGYDTEIGQIQHAIDLEQRANAPLNRATAPSDPGAPEAPSPHQAATPAPHGDSYGRRNATVATERSVPGMGPYRSKMEFMKDVVTAGTGGGVSHKLALVQRSAASDANNIAVGTDGGFAAPPALANEVMRKVDDPEAFMGMCDVRSTDTDTYRLLMDTKEPWSSDGGVQAYWTEQGEEIPLSKGRIQKQMIEMHKVAAAVPVSQETLNSAPEMTRLIQRAMPSAIDNAIHKAILLGTGSGQPLGILTATDALHLAAKEVGQAPATITFDNIVDLENGVHVSCRSRAINICNQDAIPQLRKLEDGAGRKLYLREGRVDGAPLETLNGSRIIASPHSPALGDPGDLLYVDLSQYCLILSQNARTADFSVHVKFLEDKGVFKMTTGVGGLPKWQTGVKEENSSTMRSYVSGIAQRAL